MKETDILCASDLTAAGTTALYYASRMSERMNSKVALFHVLEDDEKAARDQAKFKLQEQATAVGGRNIEILFGKGDPLDGIVEECGRGHGMLVLGTHGLKGLRQKLFGADILKLIRKVGIPSLVVQEASPKQDELGPIVLPVAAHEDIHRLLDAVIEIARAYTTEVLVYQLMRPGEALPTTFSRTSY